MKKILVATTALVATAGMAAAEVSFGGYGRFGVAYTEGRVVGGVLDETFITSRFRLTIDGKTEADNGLTFGARVRIQQNEGSAAGTGINKARFYAKSGGLEVGVGNIFGTMDSLPGLYSGTVGLTGLGYANVVTNFNAFSYSSGGAGQAPEGVELIYSGGAYTAHLSHGDTGTQAGRTELGGSFSLNDWTVGVAFANKPLLTEAGTNAVLTLGGKLGAASVGLAFAQNQAVGGAKTNAMTLSGAFEVGAATKVTAYVAQDKAQLVNNAYGIGVSHSLGGGASIQGGVADVHGTTRADLGVLFNF